MNEPGLVQKVIDPAPFVGSLVRKRMVSRLSGLTPSNGQWIEGASEQQGRWTRNRQSKMILELGGDNKIRKMVSL
jgi:hypothetical protein